MMEETSAVRSRSLDRERDRERDRESDGEGESNHMLVWQWLCSRLVCSRYFEVLRRRLYWVLVPSGCRMSLVCQIVVWCRGSIQTKGEGGEGRVGWKGWGEVERRDIPLW
jgi:hypothetical protein